MGNKVSIDGLTSPFQDHRSTNHDDEDDANTNNQPEHPHQKYRSFPGSAMLEKTMCGSIDTTDPTEYRNVSTVNQLLKRVEIMCVSSPVSSLADERRKRYMSDDDGDDDEEENSIRDTSSSAARSNNHKHHHTKSASSNAAAAAATSESSSLPQVATTTTTTGSSSNTPKASKRKTSKLLARALVSEVTDNPHTMKQADMQERERRLLKAAAAAARYDTTTNTATTTTTTTGTSNNTVSSLSGGTIASSSRIGMGSKPVGASAQPHVLRSMAFACTGDENAVGDLCPAMEGNEGAMVGHLSALGSLDDGNQEIHNRANHPHTVTIGVALSRQSPDGHPGTITRQATYDWTEVQDRALKYVSGVSAWRGGGGDAEANQPDQLHIPLIHLHCPTEASVEEVICVLASGEIFIPFMEILPDQVSTVHHSSTGLTDLVMTFGCERNDDVPVEEWPNWCLEFMHNQLYDYFSGSATWMKRSFSVTLAQQVRWKTVKHMNRYFEVSGAVVKKWRAMGPQRLEPSSTPSAGGASADEVAHPHGIYLYRGGAPTNYFAPNFTPPYTTKLTRSLLTTVLHKSWDGKRREWSSRPVPRLAAPATLLSVACGYDPGGTTGFMAKEVTTRVNNGTGTTISSSRTKLPVAEVNVKASGVIATGATIGTPTPRGTTTSAVSSSQPPEPLSEVEFGRSASGEASLKENHPKRIEETTVVAVDSMFRKPGMAQVVGPTANRHHHQENDDTTAFSVAHSTYNSVADSGTTVLQSNVSQPRKPFSRQPQQTQSKSTKTATTNKSARNDSKSDATTVDTTNSEGHLYSDDGSLEVRSTFSDDRSRSSSRKNELVSPKWLQSPTREVAMQQRERPSKKDTASKIMGSPVSLKSSPTKRAQFKMDQEKAATTSSVASPRGRGGSVEAAGSMEYSTDGSSAFFTADAASLYGQHLMSSHDGEATPSAVTTSSQLRYHVATTPTTKPLLEPVDKSYRTCLDEDDDESALLSLQESSSSGMQSVVPTDEELFSVGWAKALDPNSGSYYYFTLDRTRTVWENPLTLSQFGDEMPPPIVVQSITSSTTPTHLTQQQPQRRVVRAIDP